jgi:hypothetical protein
MPCRRKLTPGHAWPPGTREARAFQDAYISWTLMIEGTISSSATHIVQSRSTLNTARSLRRTWCLVHCGQSSAPLRVVTRWPTIRTSELFPSHMQHYRQILVLILNQYFIYMYSSWPRTQGTDNTAPSSPLREERETNTARSSQRRGTRNSERHSAVAQ